jgi:hypothetical protein
VASSMRSWSSGIGPAVVPRLHRACLRLRRSPTRRRTGHPARLIQTVGIFTLHGIVRIVGRDGPVRGFRVQFSSPASLLAGVSVSSGTLRLSSSARPRAAASNGPKSNGTRSWSSSRNTRSRPGWFMRSPIHRAYAGRPGLAWPGPAANSLLPTWHWSASPPGWCRRSTSAEPNPSIPLEYLTTPSVGRSCRMC